MFILIHLFVTFYGMVQKRQSHFAPDSIIIPFWKMKFKADRRFASGEAEDKYFHLRIMMLY